MAITGTTLASAMTASDLIANVTSATGFAAGQWIKFDGEYAVIDRSYVSGTAIPIFRRGDQGTQVVAHNALAATATGLFSDLAVVSAGNDVQFPPPSERNLAFYSVSGAIAIPQSDTIVVLNKAGVAAMTLAAPAKDQDGLTLLITSTTDQAHTVTATSLINDGVTGAPHSTITFTTGFRGQGVTLMALQGLWQLMANIACAVT